MSDLKDLTNWEAVEREDGSIFFTAGNACSGAHIAFDVMLDDIQLAKRFCVAMNTRPTLLNVAEAASCIRHWHNTGRNDEGMVVSSEHVRKLWDALAELEAIR